MKRIYWLTLLALLATLLPSMAWAVGKQTADPNAVPQRPILQVIDAGSDVGLAKKITYSAQGKMLYQVVDDIEKFTDAKLYTGRSSSDWQTRELRLSINAKDISLQDLMQSIGRVLRLQWIRGSVNGKMVYRVFSEEARTEETAEQKAARELTRRRAVFFSQFMGIARSSQPEIEHLQSANPEMYKLAKTPYGIPVARFLADTPAASSALIEGKQLTLRGREIVPSAVNELLPALQGSPAAPAIQPQGQIPQGLNVDTLVLEINPSSAQAGSSGLGQIKITCNGREIPITLGDSASGKAQEQADASQPEKPKPEIKPEPVAQHPDEPGLHKKVKLQVKSPATLDAMGTALAEASGFAVISDSYEGTQPTVEVPKDEMELMYLLDKMLNPIEVNWEKHGSVIELRDRNWATKRAEMKSQAEKESSKSG